MYRFLLRPRWLLLHLVVCSSLVLMINLAFWQLHRLEQRQAFNSLVRSNSSAPVAPMESVLTSATDPESVEWRPVIVTGSYVTKDAITIVNKSQNGTAGVNSVVPLRTTTGITVLINRGFIPLAQSVPTPSTQVVSVTGFCGDLRRDHLAVQLIRQLALFWSGNASIFRALMHKLMATLHQCIFNDLIQHLPKATGPLE